MAPARPPAYHQAMTEFVERSWTSSDGLRLAARDYAGAAGDARLPVICLHGLSRNARDFEDVAPAIAALGRRVLAMDVRGRGRSAWDPDPQHYTAPNYVGDLIGWTAALGIGRAVFVGTSMGGLITMALASVAPELVSGVALNDIGPEIAPQGLARIGGYVGGGEAVAGWTQAAAYARAVNGVAFPAYGEADWLRFARRLFSEKDGRLVLDYDPAIAQAFAAPRGQPAPDLWPLFDALAQGRPLLLVRGALSDLMTAEISQRMQARASHMSVCAVDGVGHAPMLSEPQAATALADFLRAVD
jgi:pimeloyl-ACP methyl ester carboxylesterase